MKATPRENMLAALRCEQPPDYVPVWELEFQAWDNASGKHLIFGQEFSLLSPKEQEAAINANAGIMMEVCEKLSFSALSVVGSYWETAPGHPSYYWLPEEWKFKQNTLLIHYCKQAGIAPVGIAGALMSMPDSSENYTEYCYRLFDDPESIDRMAKERYEYGVEAAKKLRDMGIDIIVSASDIADNKGPFYSPEQMRRWFYPYLHKWAEDINKMGMYSILHTDGDISSLVEDLADSPLNAVQAIDPVAGMDIKKTKEQAAGRLCLCGNVETGLLVTGPKERIYQSTRQILTGCKDGGGLVIGASNASVPETPAENYMQIIEARKKYGMY